MYIYIYTHTYIYINIYIPMGISVYLISLCMCTCIVYKMYKYKNYYKYALVMYLLDMLAHRSGISSQTSALCHLGMHLQILHYQRLISRAAEYQHVSTISTNINYQLFSLSTLINYQISTIPAWSCHSCRSLV